MHADVLKASQWSSGKHGPKTQSFLVFLSFSNPARLSYHHLAECLSIQHAKAMAPGRITLMLTCFCNAFIILFLVEATTLGDLPNQHVDTGVVAGFTKVHHLRGSSMVVSEKESTEDPDSMLPMEDPESIESGELSFRVTQDYTLPGNNCKRNCWP